MRRQISYIFLSHHQFRTKYGYLMGKIMKICWWWLLNVWIRFWKIFSYFACLFMSRAFNKLKNKCQKVSIHSFISLLIFKCDDTRRNFFILFLYIYICYFYCAFTYFWIGLSCVVAMVCESVSTFDVYCAVLPNTKKLSLPNKVFLMCHRRKDCWTIVSSAKEDFFFFFFSFIIFLFLSPLRLTLYFSKFIYVLLETRRFWFIVRYTSL